MSVTCQPRGINFTQMANGVRTQPHNESGVAPRLVSNTRIDADNEIRLA